MIWTTRGNMAWTEAEIRDAAGVDADRIIGALRDAYDVLVKEVDMTYRREGRHGRSREEVS